MPLGEILAIASTGLSFIDRLLGYSSEKKARQEMLKQLEKAKIDEEEKKALLNELDRSYNTAAINEMNRASLGLSAILNQDTYRGLLGSKILGQRASDRLKLLQEIEQHNKKIELTKAEVPFPTPPSLSSIPLNYLSTKVLVNTFENMLQGEQNNTQNTVNSTPTVKGTSPNDLNVNLALQQSNNSTAFDVLSMTNRLTDNSLNLEEQISYNPFSLKNKKGTVGRPSGIMLLNKGMSLQEWLSR
ncbi:MAG: hypothetical protein HPY57_13105 [Ignavibacteria bacterium]|nr:hypothetical protein [Ignavibacteria bacterium]